MAPTLAQNVRIRPALKGRGPRNHWLYVFFGWYHKSDQMFLLLPFFFHHWSFQGSSKSDSRCADFKLFSWGDQNFFLWEQPQIPNGILAAPLLFGGRQNFHSPPSRGGRERDLIPFDPNLPGRRSLDRFPGWGFAGVKNYHWPLGYEIIGGESFQLWGLCGGVVLKRFLNLDNVYLIHTYIYICIYIYVRHIGALDFAVFQNATT